MIRTAARLVLFAALLLRGDSLAAQSASSGTIAGAVKDTSGAVLPGVTVEAASPALIEKVRAAVTDANGEYKIVELRPGAYTVTFSLTGFSTVKREGVELTTGFTALIGAELAVGSIQETITVSSASPVVDTQNVRVQQQYSRETWDAIPTGKSLMSYSALLLGASLSNYVEQDVGGSKGEMGGQGGFSVHGSRANDNSVTLDGMQVGTVVSSASNRNFFMNQLAVQETTMQVNGFSAEYQYSGVSMNVVPKDGGERFSGLFAASGAGSSLQADNLTADVRARGLLAVPGVKKIYDAGGSMGGPIKSGRLWFFTAHRWWGTQNYQPGVFSNATQHTFVYTPDLSRPAFFDQPHSDNSGRITWQVATKHKITVSEYWQYACACSYPIDQGNRSPEATMDNVYKPDTVTQGTWNYPATNRLLFEAGTTTTWSVQHKYPDPNVRTTDIPLVELTTGFQYNAYKSNVSGGPTASDYTGGGSRTLLQSNQRLSASYVTGSHAFKTGLFLMLGYGRDHYELNDTAYGPIAVQLRNGLPAGIVEAMSPLDLKFRLLPDIGLYGQDQWTLRKLTLNLGLRYDHIREYNLAATEQATAFTAPLQLPTVNDVPNWRDISPRFGAAYDLFGNGKTAIKWSMGRFVAQESNQTALANHPVNTLANFATRTWADSNGDFAPDCVLTNPLANGECGQISNLAFGQPRQSTFYDDAYLHGWSKRGYNWQTSVSLQRELRPGVALNVGYFNIFYGNFTATANRAVTPGDFDPYCVTAPTDARLGNISGTQVCGLVDVKPARFGQVNNLVQLASNFGDQYEHYNGFDVAINARFGKGGTLSGGMNMGQSVTDSCDIVQANPQIAFAVSGGSASRTPAFCHTVNPWSGQRQFKFAGNYPLPWWGIQASGTLQSLPGLPIYANGVFTSAQIAPSLGRNLSSGAAGVATIALLQPFTAYENRITQLDVRLMKSAKIRRVTLKGMIDVYNVLNDGSILGENFTVGPQYLKPTAILGARLVKFGTQIEF